MLKRKVYFYLLPFILSIAYAVGLGFWDYFLRLKDIPIFIVIIIFSSYFFILLKQCRNVFLKNISFFILFTLILYISTSTGLLQGHMSLGIIASAFQTNQNEAFEFLSVISVKYLIFSVGLLFLTIYYLFFYKLESRLNFNKFFIVLVLLLNVVSVFFIQTADALKRYKKEEKELMEDNNGAVDWKIKTVIPKYDNQIIVIGESVPREYLSLYGFKEKTTPFLDSAPVKFIDHYVSAAPNTATSLVRTLAYMDENHDIDIKKNVVTLANQAGYNTIWISNQGFMGKNDTAVSKIAIHADHKFFLKSGNYRSKNTDDEILLKILNAQLNKYNDKKNVIFVHMMGSHPDACERLFNQPKLYPQYSNNINCYLSSLNKLDNFMQQIYSQMKSTKKSFNIIYFSDHGMSVDDFGYYVDNKNKMNYDAPFIMMGSDITKKEEVKKMVSAYDFLNIYGDQLGVNASYLNANRNLRDIPTNTVVKVFNWENYIPYETLK